MRCLGNNIKISVNNIRVAYSDEGPDDAPVIIFIHGFPFNMCMWAKQVEALKARYRVIAYDVRGHGGSDAGNDDFSIDIFTNDLIGLMDKLEIDKAILCGLSMGGYIALNAIAKYPHSFEALILSDTQCATDTPEAKEKRMKAIDNVRKNGVEQYADESIKNLCAPQSFTAKPEAIASIREMIVKTPVETICNTLLALSERRETCGKLQDIAVPVLILAGKEDKVTPPASARFMHEKIPSSTLNIIEHAGHVANMENSDAFNEQLKTFLQQLAEMPLRLSAVARN